MVKRIIILMAVCCYGAQYLSVSAQDGDGKKPKTTASPKGNYQTEERILDTTINGVRFYSRSYSSSFSNMGDPDGGDVMIKWSPFPADMRRDLERTQDMILRQVGQNAAQFNENYHKTMKERRERRKEELKEQRVEIFSQIMELSEEESQRFWPIYNEYADKKDNIVAQRQRIINRLRKSDMAVNDADAEHLTKEYIESFNKETELREAYHKKFRAVLKPKKLLMLYKAEDAFNMYLINMMRGN